MSKTFKVETSPALKHRGEYVVTEVSRDDDYNDVISEFYISPLVRGGKGKSRCVYKVQGEWVDREFVELLIVGGASVFPARYNDDGTSLTLGAKLETELRVSHNSDSSETPKLSDLIEE